MPSWAIYGNERFRGPVLAGTGAAPFVPSDFGSDLVAWYKSDAGVTGNPITQLADNSANGNTLFNNGTVDLNATGINGQKAIEFTAANAANLGQVAEDMVINSNQYTFYAVVVMRTNTVLNGRALSMQAHNGTDTDPGGIIPVLRNGTNNQISGFHDPSFFGTAAVTLGTPYRVGCASNGTTIDRYQDGVIVGSSLTDNDVIGGIGASFCLGNRNVLDGAWDGFIGEVVITKANNASHIALGGGLDNYFKTRFGL